MCGTTRSDGSRVCSYCGYIFEDQLSENTASVEAVQSMNDLMTVADSNAVPAERQNKEAEALIESETQVMSKSGKKVLQGTLVLTNKRIALINPEDANQLSSGIDRALEKAQIVIPIDSVDSVSGQRGILRISLIVDWHNPPGSAVTTKTEFIQRSRAPNQKAINDWIPLIENQVWGESKEEGFGPTDLSELETRVLDAFTGNGWVGYFQLSRELGEKYQTSIDPDDLDNVLAKLVKEKKLEKEKVGEFFRKIRSG
jgi:hypothetical protein